MNLYTSSTPSGRRVLFLDHTGTPRAKWRVAKDEWKIYGPALQAVGKVRLLEEKGALLLMPLAGKPVKVQWDSAKKEAVFPSLMVRAHASGWLLYTKESRLLGQVILDAQGAGEGPTIRLQRSAEGPTPRDVESTIGGKSGSLPQLTQEGQVVMETTSPLAGPWAMVPYMVQAEIPELERAALGIWLEHQQPTL